MLDGDRTTTVYPNWDGPFCFTVAECCEGIRGDANGDGNDCTIGDISLLIDHLFISGVSLNCIEEANMSADFEKNITIGDISTGIDHLFISQQPLTACTQYFSKAAPQQAASDVTIWYDTRNDTTRLYITTEVALRGVHLNLQGVGKGSPRLTGVRDLDLFHGRRGDTLHVGLIDMDGPGVIARGQ